MNFFVSCHNQLISRNATGEVTNNDDDDDDSDTKNWIKPWNIGFLTDIGLNIRP
jgi:hypothetical protein